MRKILCLFVTMLLLGVGCHSESCIEQESSSRTLKQIDRQAERLKRRILNSATEGKPSGTIYYFAADGDDQNDGLSPQTPLRTIARLNALELKPSDGVMFRRGDVWRGKIFTRKGVTYSAYGRGAKPRIYGSPCDAAVEGEWVATDTPNVYMYDRELADDVGTLVFDGGEQNAIKILKVYHADGTTTNVYTNEPFSGGCDLNRDLDFFHDYRDKKRLYLCSTEGNPSSRFRSIELLTKGNIISAVDSVHIDNLCIMYGGSHGIGSATTKSLRVTNCEIGWIGGSMLLPAPPTGGRDARYGNGIEIYGGCGEFVVDNCYIYQCYDTGITNQNQEDVSDSSRTMRNVSFTNNLVERCEMSIEYYLGAQLKPTESIIENFLIEGNILRQAGYGWGCQHPEPAWAAHIKSWWMHQNEAYNFTIRRNIFDRSDANVINIVAADAEHLPTMERNTYVQSLGADGGRIGQPWADYKFDEQFPTAVEQALGEKGGKYIFITR
ncbi:MAG: right-handed parallel beta-helix repeat-containing protein [Alistipes sp.]|nr:right-handed parallel beta-helix repeat-containing protein [Alistipes sp.]